MNLDLFDFELPERLIAQTPLADRTASRLLTLSKTTGKVEHRSFRDLEDLIEPGDVLVLNDTRVIPARLFGEKAETGAKVEVLLLTQSEGDRWKALVKPGKRVKLGTEVLFGRKEDGTPMLKAVVEEEGDMGERMLRFEYEGIFPELLDRLGQMPLPPYIREQLDDRERYQTVYAKREGSAAAPTAGLHFTKEMLARLEEKGVRVAYVTLHVGLGTFRPVSVDDIHEHKMHEEYYEISAETIEAVRSAKRDGKRVIAVGTTSCRTLETAAGAIGGNEPAKDLSGWTDIFIYPGYEYQWVDALVTNFHLPKSTLLMLISALAGLEHVLHAYKEAVEREYRFFSFGDAMFIY